MTNIDKVRTCHNIWMEMDQLKNKDVWETCCQEVNLNYVPGDRDSMCPHDPLFQLSFRTGEVWDLQNQIFDMWQKFECKGQTKPKSPKKPAPSKGKSKAKVKPVPAKPLTKLANDMKLHHFRALQGITNAEHVMRLLQ